MSKVYTVENMEHGVSWVEADTATDAVNQCVYEGCDVVHDGVSSDGTFDWFAVFDSDDGSLVDHFMVREEEAEP